MPRVKQTPQEKATVAELRALYGGMMSMSDICKEINRKKDAARRWVAEAEIDAIMIGNRKNYRTCDVALAIEAGRYLA